MKSLQDSAERYIARSAVPSPNLKVNRLIEACHRQQRSNSLAGARGEWNGLPPMPSIPDDQELQAAGLSYTRLPVTTGQTKQKSVVESPDVNRLEELGM